MPRAYDARAMIARDHRYVDATETLTVTSADGTQTASVVDCRRTNRPTNQVDIGRGSAPGTVVTFYLWTEVCPFKPEKGDMIVDGQGVSYRVFASALTTMRTRYDVDTQVDT